LGQDVKEQPKKGRIMQRRVAAASSGPLRFRFPNYTSSFLWKRRLNSDVGSNSALLSGYTSFSNCAQGSSNAHVQVEMC
jgi:hypothetical protein